MTATLIDKTWQDILQHLRARLSRPSIEAWIKQVHLVEQKDEELIIQANSPFYRDCIQKQYGKAIAEAAQTVTGQTWHITFTALDVASSPRPIAVAQERLPRPATNSTGHGALNPKYVFNRFVVGSTNQMGHASCLAVAELPGQHFNPLFLCGGVGLGKTHLMHAIGHYRLEVDPNCRVCYVTTERFTNDLIEAINRNAMQTFRERYRKVDVLLVDDVQFLEGKEYTQEEFFHTFNVLYEDGKQVVLAADRPPNLLPGLQERLCSRFSMGLVSDIQQPDLETRIAILQKKAEYENIDVPYEVIHHIANTYISNIRELEGALIRAIAYVSISGLPLKVSTIRHILAPQPMTGEITPEAIVQMVSEEMNVSVEDMKSDSRKREISESRQIAMFLLRNYTDLSLPKIGALLGGKDHTTVMYAAQKVTKSKHTDPQLARLLQRLGQRIVAESRH
ncbi:chromosomal replication initiator protein DnaA [Candidatus Cyanaurora vandensis]|uniref:chromosomal replication initiator protein DnaA n=1 Tax=Candidatus Cyanaurora vandensis TaxID=2714958 RepID=UPI00257D1159|nr:chromosomal replication initiator protein DnaA [Candidatus Cyanaurora vandensis]